MTTKPPIEHKDKLGRNLVVGDCVCFPDSNTLYVGVVKKLNPKMVKVVKVPSGWRSDGQNKYPSDLVKLDGPEITMWLLKNGK